MSFVLTVVLKNDAFPEAPRYANPLFRIDQTNKWLENQIIIDSKTFLYNFQCFYANFWQNIANKRMNNRSIYHQFISVRKTRTIIIKMYKFVSITLNSFKALKY